MTEKLMSEKRFNETERGCYCTTLVFDNQTQEKLGTDKVVVLLNEQQDIIGEQKIAIDELITDYKKLEEEKEQLKKQNKQLRKLIDWSEINIADLIGDGV